MREIDIDKTMRKTKTYAYILRSDDGIHESSLNISQVVSPALNTKKKVKFGGVTSISASQGSKDSTQWHVP